jgi:tetratricopeptide (TPR) repeat protein
MKEQMMKINRLFLGLLLCFCAGVSAQSQNFTNTPKKAKTLLAEAESEGMTFPGSEAKIRKAKAIDQDNSDISYNFGNLYINNNELESARLRLIESIEGTEDKTLKHKSYHNLGNVLMKEEQYQMAVDAYKDALRNDPTDEETRYNLAYAKSKLEEEKNDDNQDGEDNQDESQDENEDQDESEDNKDEGENEDKDKGDEDKNEEEDKGDENESDEDQKDDKGNKNKDEKEQDGEGDDKKEQPQQPQNQQGQISPEQIKRLLEAIENQEKDVQEKLNAQKAKGQKSKTGKDW